MTKVIATLAICFAAVAGISSAHAGVNSSQADERALQGARDRVVRANGAMAKRVLLGSVPSKLLSAFDDDTVLLAFRPIPRVKMTTEKMEYISREKDIYTWTAQLLHDGKVRVCQTETELTRFARHLEPRAGYTMTFTAPWVCKPEVEGGAPVLVTHALTQVDITFDIDGAYELSPSRFDRSAGHYQAEATKYGFLIGSGNALVLQ